MKTVRKFVLVPLVALMTLGFNPLSFAGKPQPHHGFPKPKHKYVYYPKQNIYYVPTSGVYYVWHEEQWVTYHQVPTMYARVNFNRVPHVDLFIASNYPYYYNVEHRVKYRKPLFVQEVRVVAPAPPRPPKPRVRAEVSINFTPVVVHSRPVYVERHHGHGKGHHKHHGHGHGHGRGHH